MHAAFVFVTLLLFVAASGQAPGQTEVASQGTKASFTMRIRVDSETVRRSSEVSVVVDITNVSDQPISLWQSRTGPPPYSVKVLNSAGEETPLTSVGRAFRKAETTIQSEGKQPRRIAVATGASVKIAPGQTIRDAIAIEHQVDLSRPGTYTVQLERVDPVTNLSVKSNVVTLKIVDGEVK